MKASRFGPVFAAVLLLFAGPAGAADLTRVDRAIAKEPAYHSKAPAYCLLVFGPEAKAKVWLVIDGGVLYADKNGNGDLTDKDDRIQPESREKDPAGGRQWDFETSAPGKPTRVIVYYHKDARIRAYDEDRVQGAGVDGQGNLQFAAKPGDAPIVHFDTEGPLSICLDEPYALPRGQTETEIYAFLGKPGLGKGTFAWIRYDEVPRDVHPVADIEFPAKKAGDKPIQLQVVLNRRC